MLFYFYVNAVIFKIRFKLVSYKCKELLLEMQIEFYFLLWGEGDPLTFIDNLSHKLQK